MRKLSIILLLFYPLLTYAQPASIGVNFASQDYFTILSLAKEQDKSVFIEFGVHCGFCYKMKKEVFSDKRVGSFYNKNFINLIVDETSLVGRDLAERFNTYSYPTYFYLNPNGEIIHIAANYKSADKIIKEGEQALSEKAFRPSGVWWNKLKTRNKKVYPLFNYANQAFLTLTGVSDKYSSKSELEAFSTLKDAPLDSISGILQKSLAIEEYYFNTFVAAVINHLAGNDQLANQYARKALYDFPHLQEVRREGTRDKMLSQIIQESENRLQN